MEIYDFFSVLNKELLKMKDSYYRKSEGLVYIGYPKINWVEYSRKKYQMFSYYLCFFVAFDLLIYSYAHEEYEVLKEKLKVPKFEYGLTNTFYFPEELFKRLNSSVFEVDFSVAFNNFVVYLEAE